MNNYVSGLDIYYAALFIIMLEYVLSTVCCEIVRGVTVAAVSYVLSLHILPASFPPVLA